MFKYYIRQQVWISLRLYIGQILVGYGLGWTAPIIPKLSDTKTSPLPYELTETETSLIASIIYVGTILGPYVTSYLCNAVGRKPCFILAGVSSLTSFLLLANANNLAMIYVGRILCGLGSGIIFIVNLVYIGEIASTNIRGILLTSNAIFTTLGTLIVYSVGPFVSYPLVSYIAVPIAGIYLLGIIFIPESPTYLMLKDRRDAVRNVLEQLGRRKEYHDYEEMNKNVEKHSSLKQWKQLLTIKSNRKALFITLTLGILQQCSGILPVIFFATTIFQLAGSSIEPHIATIIIGGTQKSSSILTPFFIERVGRRILLIFSTSMCTLSLATLGVYFYLDNISHPSVTKMQWLPLVTLIIFFLSYDFGFGMIPGTLIGEMFQSNVRSIGSTISMTVPWIFGFGLTTVFGYMISGLGSHVPFWIFSSTCALACIFGIFVVPETKGKTLIEIQEMLNK